MIRSTILPQTPHYPHTIYCSIHCKNHLVQFLLPEYSGVKHILEGVTLLKKTNSPFSGIYQLPIVLQLVVGPCAESTLTRIFFSVQFLWMLYIVPQLLCSYILLSCVQLIVFLCSHLSSQRAVLFCLLFSVIPEPQGRYVI